MEVTRAMKSILGDDVSAACKEAIELSPHECEILSIHFAFHPSIN